MASRRFFTAGEKQTQRQGAERQSRPVAFDLRHQHPTSLRADVLLTTEQVREKLSLGSVDAVYRRVKELGLKRVNVGGVWRFRLSDVERWLDEQNPEIPALRAVR